MNPEENEEDKYRRLAENQLYCELNIAKTLDTIANVPILMQNQGKAMEYITNKVVTPYLNFNPDFENEWTGIKEDVTSIFQIVNQALQKSGMSNALGRPSILSSIIMMVVMFVPMILLMLFLPDLYFIALFAFLPIMCLYSYYKNRRSREKVQILLNQVGPIIENQIGIYREKLIPRIQDLINSSSRILNDNEINPEKYKMTLFSNQYDNIEVLSSQPFQGYNYFIVRLK